MINEIIKSLGELFKLLPNLIAKYQNIPNLEFQVSHQKNTIEEQEKKIEKLESIIKSLHAKLKDAGIPTFDISIINENINTYSESYKLCQAAAAWVDMKKYDWVKQIKNINLSTYKEDLNSESKLKSFEEDILHYLELLADSLRSTMFLNISAVKPSINSNSSKLLYKKVLTYIRNIDEVPDISTEEFAKIKEYFDVIIGNL